MSDAYEQAKWLHQTLLIDLAGKIAQPDNLDVNTLLHLAEQLAEAHAAYVDNLPARYPNDTPRRIERMDDAPPVYYGGTEAAGSEPTHISPAAVEYMERRASGTPIEVGYSDNTSNST